MPANLKKRSSDPPKRSQEPNPSNPSVRETPGLNYQSCLHHRNQQHPTSIPWHIEWIHAITILLGQPLISEIRQHIQKWIIYQANLSYMKFALRWDPIQFEDNKHLQKYEETNGSIPDLKSNTVKKLVSLKIDMILLISQVR